jgi:hypothetical protein
MEFSFEELFSLILILVRIFFMKKIPKIRSAPHFEVNKLFRKLVVPWRFTSKRGQYLGIGSNFKTTKRETLSDNIFTNKFTWLLGQIETKTDKPT